MHQLHKNKASAVDAHMHSAHDSFLWRRINYGM